MSCADIDVLSTVDQISEYWSNSQTEWQLPSSPCASEVTVDPRAVVGSLCECPSRIRIVEPCSTNAVASKAGLLHG
jgi:hypothetical protein